MNPILYARKSVLKVSQAEFATIAGVSQGTISKWEAGESAPNRDQLSFIRTAIIERGHPWDDRWFFEAPTIALDTDSDRPTKAEAQAS